jgi:hypothetical protein
MLTGELGVASYRPHFSEQQRLPHA